MPLATASMISIFALVEIKRFCINEISLSSNLYRCISFALRISIKHELPIRNRWLDINGFMRKLENWATLTGSACIFQFHTHGRCYCFILHLQKKNDDSMESLSMRMIANHRGIVCSNDSHFCVTDACGLHFMQCRKWSRRNWFHVAVYNGMSIFSASAASESRHLFLTRTRGPASQRKSPLL